MPPSTPTRQLSEVREKKEKGRGVLKDKTPERLPTKSPQHAQGFATGTAGRAENSSSVIDLLTKRAVIWDTKARQVQRKLAGHSTVVG